MREDLFNQLCEYLGSLMHDVQNEYSDVKRKILQDKIDACSVLLQLELISHDTNTN